MKQYNDDTDPNAPLDHWMKKHLDALPPVSRSDEELQQMFSRVVEEVKNQPAPQPLRKAERTPFGAFWATVVGVFQRQPAWALATVATACLAIVAIVISMRMQREAAGGREQSFAQADSLQSQHSAPLPSADERDRIDRAAERRTPPSGKTYALAAIGLPAGFRDTSTSARPDSIRLAAAYSAIRAVLSKYGISSTERTGEIVTTLAVTDCSGAKPARATMRFTYNPAERSIRILPASFQLENPTTLAVDVDALGRELMQKARLAAQQR
jgi:hypothetical protein